MYRLDRRWASTADMCDFGAARVRDGFCSRVRFDCFNKAESEEVQEYMRDNHPDTPFHTTYLSFKG